MLICSYGTRTCKKKTNKQKNILLQENPFTLSTEQRKTTLHITPFSCGTNSSGVIPLSLVGVREVSRGWGVDGSRMVLGKKAGRGWGVVGGVEASVSSWDAADGATAFWSTERGTDPYLLITHLSLPPALLNHNYSSPYPTLTVTSTGTEGGREGGKQR